MTAPDVHEQRSRVLRWIGLGALVLLVAELVLLPALVGIDATVWHAILVGRRCGLDRSVDRVVELVTRAAIVLLAAAAVVSVRRRGLRATWPPLAVCAVGLLAGKVLKNAFARERPSMLPDVAIGHSFPSGHVMNTTLAALAVVILAAEFRHPRRWRVAAVLLLVLIVAGRVLIAHHWFLDAVGGILAAIALTGLGLEPFRRRPLLAPALLALVLGGVLAVVLNVRALAVRLPSPLMPRESHVIEVEPMAQLGTPALDGTWEAPFDRDDRQAAWLFGTGTVHVVVPPPAAQGTDDRRPLRPGAAAVVAIAGRPDIRERRCLSLRVAVNDRLLDEFVPYVGWREYRLAVPPETLRGGANEVRIDVVDGSGAPWRFGVAYVRVDLD